MSGCNGQCKRRSPHDVASAYVIYVKLRPQNLQVSAVLKALKSAGAKGDVQEIYSTVTIKRTVFFSTVTVQKNTVF